MAQLTSLRQRIKAIETIKKITHAMRLISMSMHSRLRQKENHLAYYKNKFSNLWFIINQSTNQTNKAQENKPYGQDIVILIGSQKGLCGAFNSVLFKYFENFYEINKIAFLNNIQFITIGKHATDYLIRHEYTPKVSFDTFNPSNFVQLAHTITNLIIKQNPQSVTIYSNNPQSFFVQKSGFFQLLPISPDKNITNDIKIDTEYLFEQNPELLLMEVKKLFITVLLQNIFFKSLMAEQAARFLSMDTSTRNAEKVLENMKLAYNKIRQAAITRELSELTTSL